MGLFFAPIANLVLSAVSPSLEGKASGASNTIREIGGVFGVAVLATVFSANGSYVSPQTYVDGLVPAVWVGAFVVGLGAIAALMLPGRRALGVRELPGVIGSSTPDLALAPATIDGHVSPHRR
jgi:hypothetical protein